MKEIWKDIEGYEGLYQVSNTGFVRTHINKTTFTALHGKRKWKQRILKGRGKNKVGYRVSLWKEGKVKDYKISRLVTLAFLKNPKNKKLTVNHIDGNKYNNNIKNLEWLTLTDNIRHGFENNLYPQINVNLVSNDEILSFTSLKKASIFIGKNHGFLSCAIKRNKREVFYKNKLYRIDLKR